MKFQWKWHRLFLSSWIATTITTSLFDTNSYRATANSHQTLSNFQATATITSVSKLVTKTNPVIGVQRKQQGSRAEHKVEDNNFRFQLQNCQKRGEEVTCSFLITNLSNQDRQLLLCGVFNGTPSRIFDFSGNEYYANLAQLGTHQDGSGVQAILLKGIPIKASIKFKIPQEVIKISVFEIAYISSKLSKVEFRNLEIIKSN